MNESRVKLAGSAPPHENGGAWLPAVPGQRITATIVVRRPASTADIGDRLLAGESPFASREEAENALAATAGDLNAIENFAHGQQLKVLAVNAQARTVQVSGTLEQFGQAFGATIERRQSQGGEYLSYQGELSAPASLAGIIEAVLGLDQRPIARRNQISEGVTQ